MNQKDEQFVGRKKKDYHKRARGQKGDIAIKVGTLEGVGKAPIGNPKERSTIK